MSAPIKCPRCSEDIPLEEPLQAGDYVMCEECTTEYEIAEINSEGEISLVEVVEAEDEEEYEGDEDDEC